MASINSFVKEIKDSHERLERKSAALKSALRDMKQTKGDIDLDEICLQLQELKKLKCPLDDMIKFLEEMRTKITDAEVSMYEAMGIESRGKTGRSLQGQNNDSGCFSADSRVLSTESFPVVQPSDAGQSDDISSTSRAVFPVHTEPTQHEDTSQLPYKDEDSTC